MCKYRPGLTEKRMRDKRFKRTEEAILRVFFEEDNYISPLEMAKKVGVARSTFYHHHRAIREIIPDYEKFLLCRYRRKIRRLLKKRGVRMRVLFFEMLVFIMKHQETFGVLIRNKNTEIIEEMIKEMLPRIGQPMGLPKNSGKIVRVYISEIIEVIKMWGEEGFSSSIGEVLDNMMYLTETARLRLKPLLRI